MPTSIALLRGVNVGGKHSLPMRQLVEYFQSAGCENVRTYIQSGNVVFRSPAGPARTLAGAIARQIEVAHGFRPCLMILTDRQLAQAIRANPFPEVTAEPTTLHLFFLAALPVAPDFAALDRLKASRERYHLDAGVFYLHAPDGIGRSKLAASTERLLGVPATARNWRTVQKLDEMAAEH